jgi:hydrogenase maturation factor
MSSDQPGLATGKLSTGSLAKLLAALPPLPPEVLLGPAVGEDACALRVPPGVMVAATDPVTMTAEGVGRWSVVVNANDVAVSGARPRWFLAAILVPPGTPETAVYELQVDIRDALVSIGAHLVGGHTEVTSAVTRPVVVGQMLGLVEDGTIVTSAGASVGDAVVQVGPVPIEGAAVLALEAAGDLGRIDPSVIEAARGGLESPGISVVEPALLAKRLGATALHDPTEGGLAAGLHEMARAAHVGIRVDREAVQWFEPGLALCRSVGVDPWSTLASGSLLAAFHADSTAPALAAFAARGYAAAAIGTVVAASGVQGDDGCAIPWPDRDALDGVLYAEGLSRRGDR